MRSGINKFFSINAGRGVVFEGCVAVGPCGEYLMQVSPAQRVKPRGISWCFAAVQFDGEEV